MGGACDRLIEQMRHERATLTAVTDRLQTRLDETAEADGSTVRDLMAHYAAWQRIAVRRIGTLKAGGEVNLIEADDVNPLVRQIARMWSDDEVRWEFDDAFEAMAEAVRTSPEDACEAEGWAHRYAGRMAGSHYPDHLPALQRLADGEG